MSDRDSHSKPPGSGDSGHDADPIIGEAVGSRLKSLFDDFTKEEVPDRFLDLIGQLEQNENEDAGRDSSGTDDADKDPDGANR